MWSSMMFSLRIYVNWNISGIPEWKHTQIVTHFIVILKAINSLTLFRNNKVIKFDTHTYFFSLIIMPIKLIQLNPRMLYWQRTHQWIISAMLLTNPEACTIFFTSVLPASENRTVEYSTVGAKCNGPACMRQMTSDMKKMRANSTTEGFLSSQT